MKKSMIITIYCVFGCQIASYELDTPVYKSTGILCIRLESSIYGYRTLHTPGSSGRPFLRLRLEIPGKKIVIYQIIYKFTWDTTGV